MTKEFVIVYNVDAVVDGVVDNSVPWKQKAGVSSNTTM